MSAVPAGETPPSASFRDLALIEPVLRALTDVGYEAPSPIQAATIPVLLSGADMLGQAQTGTGKTAAFALPALSRIDLRGRDPQVLVLVPTRELALQVAEAFQRYAAYLEGFHVLPIYGGQSYQPQLNALRRGVHVVVGTPGRVIDHMNRGTLKLSALTLLVLDEADEMLRMGFLDAVESILVQTPKERQVALFSATMPAPIRRIAQKHLRSPVEVTIKSKTSTATNIRHSYWVVSGIHKLDALTRILETVPFDGMLVFTRTKQATVELAEKLEARGFAAAALNGDMPQQQRERTVSRLKAGQIDIVVATDVAARGLDVERIGHVVNYDVPYDPESYVHRVGRTGRAGRQGEAILFIAPRERNLLRAIERATRQMIEPMNLPTVDAVNASRIAKFKQRVLDSVAQGEGAALRPILEQLEAETGLPLIDIAAALASFGQGGTPLLLPEKAPRTAEPMLPRVQPPHPPLRPPLRTPLRTPESAQPPPTTRPSPRSPTTAPHAPESASARVKDSTSASPPRNARGRNGDAANAASTPAERARAAAPRRVPPRTGPQPAAPQPAAPRRAPIERSSPPAARGLMETFRIEVGSLHGVKPGQVVGAIAAGAGIDGVHIGRVDIREDHSFVNLPEGMPKGIFKQLQGIEVAGRALHISKVSEKPPKPSRDPAGRHVGRLSARRKP